jgi:filamentous hemagglutinin family protein
MGFTTGFAVGSPVNSQRIFGTLGSVLGSLSIAITVSPGAIAETITPANDGTGTIVLPSDAANTVSITGGQVSGDGGNLFHSFQEFGLNANEAAIFQTSPAINNVLGRVVGGNVSFIDGELAIAGSQADLYLINPAGVVFGNNASLNVPGDFMVTSADAIGFGEGLASAWWSTTSSGSNWTNWANLNGDPIGFAFRLAEPGVILNSGTLAIEPGQNFSAIGGTIANTGTIAAPAGTVTALAVPGESLVRLSIPGNVLSLEVVPIVSPPTNLSLAETLPQLLTGNTDLQTASQLTVNADGSVSLVGSALGIAIDPGTVLLSGTIDVANDRSADFGTTQQASILGEQIAVLDATIDASGLAGGGTVLLGGEFQGNGTLPNADVLYVDERSQINTDAVGSGDGGTAILWADGVTIADGTITARGENGGFVEVSGKQALSFDGAIDVSGTSGVDGTVLFDPEDLTLGGDEFDEPPIDNFDEPPINDFEEPPINDFNEPPIDDFNEPPIDDFNEPPIDDFNEPPFDDFSEPPIDDFNEPPIDDFNEPPIDNFDEPPIDDFSEPPIDDFNEPPFDDFSEPPIDDFNEPPFDDFDEPPIDDFNEPPIDDFSEPPIDDFDEPPIDDFSEPPIDERPLPFDPDASFDDRLDALDFSDPDELNAFEDSIRDLPLSERLDAQQQIDTRQNEIAQEAQNDPSAAVDRFIRNQNASNQLPVERVLSEITNEQLRGVSGNVVFLAENNLTIDRPVNRSSSIAFQAGNRLEVNAPIVTSGTAANVFLSSGNDLEINANINTSGGNGDITIVADDSGLGSDFDTGRRGLFSENGVSITQAPGTTLNAGNGNISIALDGEEVNSITLGNITTTGSITVNANGGDILRLDSTTTIRANTGSFTTTGIGQIGEATNPLVVDIARLTSRTDNGLVFINDINRTDLEENTRNFAQDVPSEDGGAETDAAADGGDGFEIEDDGESGDSSEEDSGDGESGEFDDFISGEVIEIDPTTEIAALEQDRLQEFSRFLGRNLANTGLSATGAREALTQIAQQTGNQTAAVYVTLLPDRVDLLVFSSNGDPVRRSVEVKQETIVNAVTDLRYAITSPRDRLRGNQRYLQIGQQLYDWLVAPIAADLEANQINTLVFSMPAGLRGLPIAAMYNNDHFLVEDYSLGLIPSLALVDTQYRPLANTELLAMGASEFQNLSALPAVPLELSTITNSLWQGTTLLNESFTRSNITRTRDRNPYPIIHLATHGEFGSGETGSFIQLWDERLYLDQIREMGWNDPPVELLVLSACRTAVGDEAAELGFAGFAIAAGVKSALASLWYVSDVGTLTLMTQFYQQLSQTGIKAEALRQAQLALINNDFELLDTGEIYFPSFDRSFPLPEGANANEIRNLSHPYYWSAFTMIGSPW